MLEKKFKDGDRVKLKSGGPLMTVSNAAAEKIECTWFLEGSIQHDSFNPESLKVFEAKKRTVATST